MLLNGLLGKTLLIPTPGQAQLFKPSKSSTSTSCSITTAKNGFHPQTTMLQRLALLNSTTTTALFPFLPLPFLLLCVFGRMWKTATQVLALHCPCNVGSPNRHKLALRNPTTDHMRDVHKLHITQSVPVLDENSALRHNMQQRDNDEGGNPQRLSFSPAVSVWGQMGCAWTSGDRNARTTELVAQSDYVAFFHQYFGITNNPALAPFANVPCGCQRYFMGGEGAWDHGEVAWDHVPCSFFKFDSCAQSRLDDPREHLQ